MADSSDKELLHEALKDADSSSILISCACAIDPRERHFVCKLDRNELEDRYLRLLEEMQSLKKLCNSQEDKIKRLATRLMRFGANPRSDCVLNCSENRDKLSILEAENTKLRNKVCLLRNQLMNNKMVGPSSRHGRRSSLPLGSSSGPTSCRSENSRIKLGSCQCISSRPATSADDNDLQNYALKIEEMETEKKEMLSRITELEVELASLTSGNRREKVAENVEYIRVWRQMKRQNEKLVNAQAANDMLNDQICQLKRNLEDCCKSKEQMSAVLAAERKQLAEMDDNVIKAQDSEIQLREKDDRITDLMKEIEILQQHNRELLDLSGKFGKVEQENKELRRKNTEQLSDYQNLRDTLGHEKANMAALQAANDQLLAKLHDLQKNIDVMTIQLMEQNDKNTKVTSKRSSKRTNASASLSSDVSSETSKKLSINDKSEVQSSSSISNNSNNNNSNNNNSKNQSSISSNSNNQGNHSKSNSNNQSNNHSKSNINSSSSSSSNNNIKERNTDVNKGEKINSEHYEKGVQACVKLKLINETTQTDSNNHNNNDTINNAAKPNIDQTINDKSNNKNFIPITLSSTNNGGRNTLSREGMLKLLEQVQISTPLESQNASVMRRVDAAAAAVNLYANVQSRQPSNLETFLFGDSSL